MEWGSEVENNNIHLSSCYMLLHNVVFCMCLWANMYNYAVTHWAWLIPFHAQAHLHIHNLIQWHACSWFAICQEEEEGRRSKNSWLLGVCLLFLRCEHSLSSQLFMSKSIPLAATLSAVFTSGSGLLMWNHPMTMLNLTCCVVARERESHPQWLLITLSQTGSSSDYLDPSL